MPLVRITYPRGALTREGAWGVGGQTVSALDVAQFINSELPAERRAEIAASVARQTRQ